MYKLILVDDETLLLESMASAFEWEKYGFSLAGTFLNAESAIAYMKENSVDVIISDIKMPGMNGVRFAAYVYNNYPDTAFVIISGYESFEYAKEAMGYNVREYLLKPLSYDNITETLKKIRCDLDKRLRSLRFVTDDNVENQEVISKFLLKKENNISAVEAMMANHGFKTDIWNTPVAYMCIDVVNMKEFLLCHGTYGRDGLNNAINNFMNYENALVIPLKYFLDSNEYIIFFAQSDNASHEEFLDKFKKTIERNAWEILKLKLNVGIKKVENNIFDIIDIFGDEYGKSINEYAVRIFELACQGGKDEAVKVYREFENSCGKRRESIWFFRLLLAKLIRNRENFERFSDKLKRSVTEKISEANAAADVIEELARESMRLSVYSPVETAKLYVKENYLEKINVDDVAQRVHMSVSWFSKQFKKETGMSFVDYINAVRIEKAKELLKNSNLTINEVYEKAGYKSRNHFYGLFRRYTGMSAHEYRKMIRNNSKQ